MDKTWWPVLRCSECATEKKLIDGVYQCPECRRRELRRHESEAAASRRCVESAPDDVIRDAEVAVQK